MLPHVGILEQDVLVELEINLLTYFGEMKAISSNFKNLFMIT